MRFQPYPTYGFTTKANGIARELANEIYVSEAYDPATGGQEPVRKPYIAVWDTGATNTVICSRVVKELNLQPSGRITCEAVGAGDQVHRYEANTYLVNIVLPNNVRAIGVKASEGSTAGCDVLIGMDIISNGDLAITNYNGQTWWTFRTPSNEPIDFVKDIGEFNRIHGPKSTNPQFQHWLARDKKKQGMRKKKKR